MLEVIRGNTQKPVSCNRLIEYLENKKNVSGVLYIGYPIIGTPIGSLSLDAIFISKEYGLFVFDVEESNLVNDRTEVKEEIYNNLTAKLWRYKQLVFQRNLKVDIHVETYAPVANRGALLNSFCISNEDLDEYLEKNQQPLEEELYQNLLSVIQAVTNLRRVSRRLDVNKQDSRGSILKMIEASIANLDKDQNSAIIETVEGLQRIRGLAGSGKTIVLALKAAYLHATNPTWDVAITFNTRSLRTQFRDLITRFSIELTGEEPDWNKVKVLQAWGSEKAKGIYYEICEDHNIPYLDFRSAKNLSISSKNDGFNMACQRALEQIKDFKESYDVILIDEAQDFSDSFLKLCYNILKTPKRLIWAYDELQKLNEASLSAIEKVFGKELRNEPGKPKQDIILAKCYRNSRPLLATAQALGFGIYREDGLVQMFDRPTLWKDIGYEVIDGDLVLGQKVTLERTINTSPLFLESHSAMDDIISVHKFLNEDLQIEWLVKEIEKNLKEDELACEDILIINPDPLTTEKFGMRINKKLLSKGINSHITGVTSSRDSFYVPNSIAITGIYRAKGNEAAMVYILNSQYAFGGLELIKKRNILFTAITRSKAWVRICGYGVAMDSLDKEIMEVKRRNFQLNFLYPTFEEMKKLNIIHREMTRDEKSMVETSKKNLNQIARFIKDGKLKKEDLEDMKELKSILFAESDSQS